MVLRFNREGEDILQVIIRSLVGALNIGLITIVPATALIILGEHFQMRSGFVHAAAGAWLGLLIWLVAFFAPGPVQQSMVDVVEVLAIGALWASSTGSSRGGLPAHHGHLRADR